MNPSFGMSASTSQPELQSGSSRSSDHGSPGAVVGLGLLLVLAPVLLRCVTGYDPMPIWNADPTRVETPVVSLTPMLSLACDTIAVIGAAMLFAARWRAISPWTITLAVIGVAACLAHSFNSNTTPESIVTASAWAAAVTGGVAIFTACRRGTGVAGSEWCRRTVLATCIGLIGVLGAKAALQVWVEHPAMLAAYRENTQAILEANGWNADSPMARAYERRLNQPEATGWFGLANVFSTLAAGTCVACAAILLAAWKRDAHARWVMWGAIAGFLLAGGALVLAGGKGGFAAAGGGLVLVVIGWLARSFKESRFGYRERLWCGRALGLAAILVPLAAVVVRGFVGERIGELSILFRWFYMQASARIIESDWLVGVGPAGFKNAYQVAKNPLSPEDVSSPHSVLLDWASTLGVGGMAWGAMLIAGAIACGGALLTHSQDRRESDEQDNELRPTGRWIAATLAFGTIAATVLEQHLATPESTLVRGFGLFAGVCIGLAAFSLLRRHDWLVGAAGLTVIAHSQIEMTPVTVAAAGWVCIWIGAIAAGSHCHSTESTSNTAPRPVAKWRTAAAPLLALLLVGGTLALAVRPGIWRWELALRRGGDAVEMLPGMHRLMDAAFGATARTPDANAARALSAEVLAYLPAGTPSARQPSELMAQVARVMNTATERATNALRDAHNEYPTDRPTAESLTRMLLAQAAATAPANDQRSLLIEALDIAKPIAGAETAGGHAFHALAIRSVAELVGSASPNHTQLLREAAQALEKSAALAPLSLHTAVELARTYRTLGRASEAKSWADRALQLNRQLRLDPLVQLSDSVRSELEAIQQTGG